MSPVSSSLSLPEELEDGGRWYFSRKEIEEHSPSRRDGIDLKKEAYFRKAYCSFLQDLGMKLKVPQVTIATAIIFCHRFYLRQSHAKNDRKSNYPWLRPHSVHSEKYGWNEKPTVATACMFLAGKVEETPRPLKDVILVSFEIIHKKDPAAAQKIKQKEVYEQQKELILLAERVVLATLGFDLNVQHPYKPLVDSIKKFKVAQNALAQVAWNFVNDGLRTSLCLQFKTHHIAAGAIFLAAKFLKVKLPSDGDKIWWQEFDVTPRQLEEVSNQMLELYEQNRMPPSQAGEADGSTGGAATGKGISKASNEDQATHANSSTAGASSRSSAVKQESTHLVPEHVDNHSGPPRSTQNCSSDHGSSIANTPNSKEDDVHETRNGPDIKDKSHNHNTEGKEVKKFDEDKLKQLREKRRKKCRGDAIRKIDTMDEFDPIVKELEDGVELAVAEKIENEKSKQERKHSKTGNENSHHSILTDDFGDQLLENEEGEFSALENSNLEYSSPKPSDRKRKAGSPLEKWQDYPEDRNRAIRHGYGDRDQKRHVQENHV